MSKRKTRTGAPAASATGAPSRSGPGWPDAALAWAAPVVAAALLVRLATWAAGARFTSDECFHAGMAEWIAAHGTLPRAIDGLYGGFRYFYPPLLHVLGALAVKLFGAPALREVNVVLLAATFAAAWFGLARGPARTAPALAVLALVAYPGLVLQGVRLYVECLSAALAVCATLALLAVWERPGRGAALAAGALAGLGVLAKQSGLALLPVFAALAALAAWRGRRDRARVLLVALGVAVALAAPFWVRNAVLFGAPLYPVGGRDLDPRLLALNVRGFTPGWPRFMRDTLALAGALVPALVAVGLAVAAASRRTLAHALLAAGVLALLLAPRVPMLDARHAIPLVAVLVVLAAATVAPALDAAPWLRRGVLAALALFAAAQVATSPNLRAPLDMAPWMDETWAAIRARVPEHETILCIQTYDTFYYTRRDATWPIPWGQPDPPTDVFDARDPDTLAAALRRHRIGWLLLPTEARGAAFNAANFPAPFMLAVQQLGEQGRLAYAWGRPELALLRVQER